MGVVVVVGVWLGAGEGAVGVELGAEKGRLAQAHSNRQTTSASQPAGFIPTHCGLLFGSIIGRLSSWSGKEEQIGL